MLTLYKNLKIRVQIAFEKAYPEAAANAKKSGVHIDPQFTPASKPEFGDFQINGPLQLAKLLKESPRKVAETIVSQLNKDSHFLSSCEPPTIAGPGFINITIRKERLIEEVKARLYDDNLGVPLISDDSNSEVERSIVVDFSSPNIAKEMHVGHLRSTIIGDSIARILEFRGHKVIRLNHVGDWGTQFGMLIAHLKTVAPEALETANAIKLGNLVDFYREAKKRFDEEESFKIASRKEVVNLQSGDELTTKAWRLLCEQSRREFQIIYDLLNIRLIERGESFYNNYLEKIIIDLEKLKLLVADQGAKCVFLDEVKGKNGKPQAIIIQKSDGGFNYATTDLAAIKYRFNQPPKGDGAWRLIYVTDSGQANHFEGVFEIAKRAKWIPEHGRIEHVPFGLVQGEDGKKLKTRSGKTIRLRDLLDEAVNRAEIDLKKRLKEEGRDEDDSFINHVSKTIGLAAVKYADLSQNRTTNYQFSFDRMLALQGNTAPYLLYAVVRIAGIARKGGDLNQTTTTELQFDEIHEWRLIRELLKFDEIIAAVEEELLPNRLCNYLYEVSQIFNRFYDQVPVLKTNEPVLSSRLALCRLTADTLKKGLDLLGINTLQRM